MPAQARGTTYATKTQGVGIRWKENGATQRQSGFRTKTDARDWFNEHVAPRLRRGGPVSPDVTFAQFCDLFLDRHAGRGRTVPTLRERLAPARDKFGTWTLRELEGAAGDIAAWRSTLPTDSARYRHSNALRQCLQAARRWRYIDINPAVDAGSNPRPRREELWPFTPDEIDQLALELGPVYGPLCVFAAETGLRTNEWTATERRDIDRSGPAVLVQRRYGGGTVTPYPKTDRSRRRVPLSDRAVQAVDALPVRLDTRILFPAAMGGHIGLDTWRTREWYPALEAAGIDQRGPYHLRHTFATEALAAGISTFELARVMGTSLQMIDETYGHLARDSEASIRARLSTRGDRKGHEGVTDQ